MATVTPLPATKPDVPDATTASPTTGPSNPYDFALGGTSGTPSSTQNATAPTTDAGLIAGAQKPAPVVVAPTTADKTAQATATGYTGTGYDAAQGATAGWNVDPNQTVQGQVAGIIDSNSPLMQRAATRANEQMNARGLTNSSIAVGAGQSALYDAALPIAQQDASTNASAAKANQDATNSMTQFNTGATNTSKAFSAQAADQASQFDANAANQIATTNAAAKNDATKTDATLGLQAQMSNQSAAVQQSAQLYDGALKAAMQNTDAAGKLQLQQIDASTRVQLGALQARYQNQMQSSQSMAATYQSLVDSVTKIIQDPNMDGPAKQQQINNLTDMYNNSMQAQANISQLNLGTLLKHDIGTAPPDGPNSAPATAAAAAAASAAATGGNFNYSDNGTGNAGSA